MVRLAGDFRLISLGKFGIACKKMDEVGRMLGGWIKINQG
jgi:hypothetical protein